ncbi:nucleoside triphosphate pyrophosphohydrolase [Synergistales bacterium]|nr:nucleoside triphosphate pyrophosphohydrolase [Synergistales bacterium]
MSEKFDELLSIMERLRAPGGCPWDREQKMTSLRPYIVEEAYELTDAISNKEPKDIAEEAGDLLLQVVFLASIAKEDGLFGIDDVITAINDKLVRRHPHVFGEEAAEDSAAVIRNWERIKKEERKSDKGEKDSRETSVLAGVPKGLPPLAKAHRIQGKAAHVGFDWPKDDTAPLFSKLNEEVAELREAVESGSSDSMEDELGDVLFMAVNLARHIKVDPDTALSRACGKFSARFHRVESMAADAGIRLDECPLSELDELWNRAKIEIKAKSQEDK